LAWAESMTLLAGGDVPDHIYEQACEQFSIKEIADLSLAVSEINAWNRLMICSRTPPRVATDKR
jgi:alkylhydroperoxidase family enzyme